MCCAAQKTNMTVFDQCLKWVTPGDPLDPQTNVDVTHMIALIYITPLAVGTPEQCSAMPFIH